MTNVAIRVVGKQTRSEPIQVHTLKTNWKRSAHNQKHCGKWIVSELQKNPTKVGVFFSNKNQITDSEIKRSSFWEYKLILVLRSRGWMCLYLS